MKSWLLLLVVVCALGLAHANDTITSDRYRVNELLIGSSKHSLSMCCPTGIVSHSDFTVSGDFSGEDGTTQDALYGSLNTNNLSGQSLTVSGMTTTTAATTISLEANTLATETLATVIPLNLRTAATPLELVVSGPRGLCPASAVDDCLIPEGGPESEQINPVGVSLGSGTFVDVQLDGFVSAPGGIGTGAKKRLVKAANFARSLTCFDLNGPSDNPNTVVLCLLEVAPDLYKILMLAEARAALKEAIFSGEQVATSTPTSTPTASPTSSPTDAPTQAPTPRCAAPEPVRKYKTPSIQVTDEARTAGIFKWAAVDAHFLTRQAKDPGSFRRCEWEEVTNKWGASYLQRKQVSGEADGDCGYDGDKLGTQPESAQAIYLISGLNPGVSYQVYMRTRGEGTAFFGVDNNAPIQRNAGAKLINTKLVPSTDMRSPPPSTWYVGDSSATFTNIGHAEANDRGNVRLNISPYTVGLQVDYIALSETLFGGDDTPKLDAAPTLTIGDGFDAITFRRAQWSFENFDENDYDNTRTSELGVWSGSRGDNQRFQLLSGSTQFPSRIKDIRDPNDISAEEGPWAEPSSAVEGHNVAQLRKQGGLVLLGSPDTDITDNFDGAVKLSFWVWRGQASGSGRAWSDLDTAEFALKDDGGNTIKAWDRDAITSDFPLGTWTQVDETVTVSPSYHFSLDWSFSGSGWEGHYSINIDMAQIVPDGNDVECDPARAPSS